MIDYEQLRSIEMDSERACREEVTNDENYNE